MPNIKIFLWAINESRELMEKLCEKALITALLNDLNVELLGVGHKFKGHIQRLGILYDKLLGMNPSDIVICMDGSDTLFNKGGSAELIEEFEKKKTGVLLSAERLFTYQYHWFQDKFDAIESPYKYVNAGTYMGYVKSLIEMLDENFKLQEKYKTANDQGLLGGWAYNNLEKPEKVQLDSNCEVFWVTSADWHWLKLVSESSENIVNPETGNQPFIIHNTGNGLPEHNESFISAYNNIKRR